MSSAKGKPIRSDTAPNVRSPLALKGDKRRIPTREPANAQRRSKGDNRPPPIDNFRSGGIKEDKPEKKWVRTVGRIKPAGSTQSAVASINSNSLLVSGWTESNQPSALASYAKNYAKYRVMSYSLHLHVSPVAAEYAFTTWHTGSGTAPVTTDLFSAQPSCFSSENCTPHLIGQQANYSPNIIHVKSKYTLHDLVKDVEVSDDTDYTGAISTAGVFSNPTDLTVIHCVGSAFTGTLGATGPVWFGVLDQHVEFYDYRG